MKHLHYILVCLQLVAFLGGCGKSSQDAEWKSARLLARPAANQQTGIDGHGNVLAVWAESGGFFANRYKPGTGWGTAQKISDNSPGWSDLHLSVSKNGNAIAVWLRYGTGPAVLQAARFSTANGWGPVEDLEYHGTPRDVAITDAGAAFIVGSLPTGISVGRYRPDTGWFFDELPYAANATNFTGPKIGLDESGIGMVLWAEQDPDGGNVMVSLCGEDLLGPPERIASSPGIVTATALVSQNRNVMVLWGQTDAQSVPHTYARFYAASLGWAPAVQLDDSLFACLGQAVGVDPQGHYYAIWAQCTASQLVSVISARYLPSGGWQAPELVGAGGTAVLPQIAVDASGSVFAAWQQYDPTGRFPADARVYGNMRVPGAGWAVPKQLRTASGSADVPTLAVDDTGRATVLWSQSVASDAGSLIYAIYYSRFE